MSVANVQPQITAVPNIQKWCMWQILSPYTPPGQPSALSVAVPFDSNPYPGFGFETVVSNNVGAFTVTEPGSYELVVQVVTIPAGGTTWNPGSEFQVNIRNGTPSSPAFILSSASTYPPSGEPTTLMLSTVVPYVNPGGTFFVEYVQPAILTGSVSLDAVGGPGATRGCQFYWKRIQ